MNIEKFIETIMGYPFLYNMGHEFYKDVEKKTEIWKQIAELFEFRDGDAARLKWKNIRDSYVKYVRTLDPLTVEQSRYKRWPYAPQMEFLKPYLCAKRSISVTNNSTKLKPDIRTIVYVPEETNRNRRLSGVTKKKNAKKATHFLTAANQKKESKNVKLFEENRESERCVTKFLPEVVAELTPLELIFLAHARTLQTFPKRLQTAAKMMVSQVMTDIEMEFNQLNDESAPFRFTDINDTGILEAETSQEAEIMLNDNVDLQDKKHGILDSDEESVSY